MSDTKNLEVSLIDNFQHILRNSTKQIFDNVEKAEEKKYDFDIKTLQDPSTILDNKLFNKLPRKFQMEILTANNITKLLCILKNTYNLQLYTYTKITNVLLQSNDSTIHGNRKLITRICKTFDIPKLSKDIVLDFDSAGRNISYIKCYIISKNNNRFNRNQQCIELSCKDITKTHKQFILRNNDSYMYFTDFILSRLSGLYNLELLYVLEENTISVSPPRIILTQTIVQPTALSRFLMESIDNKTHIKYHVLSNYCIIEKKMSENNWLSYKIEYDLYNRTNIKNISYQDIKSPLYLIAEDEDEPIRNQQNEHTSLCNIIARLDDGENDDTFNILET